MFNNFKAFDIESTSRYTRDARVVQWAVVGFELRGGAWCCDPLHRHVALVDPGVTIPQEATKIHGITDADVVAAPTTEQSLPWLLRLLEGAVLVGYNVLEYDMEVLKAECRRHGLIEQFNATMFSLRAVVDVLPWAARTSLLPLYRKGARTLATMSRRHGVEAGRGHDAGDDATATGRLMLSLMDSGAMPSTLREVVEATTGTWEHLRCH